MTAIGSRVEPDPIAVRTQVSRQSVLRALKRCKEYTAVRQDMHNRQHKN